MPFLSAEVPELSLDEILVLEGTSEVMGYEARNTGVPMWPLVRARFLRQIMSDLLFSGNFAGQPVTVGHPGKALAAMGRYAFHNAFASAVTGPVTIMSTAVGGGRRDGKWFNRLTDHFAMRHPDISCVIEDDLHWNYPGPRYFDRVRYNAPNKAATTLLGKMLARKADYTAATALVELVTQRARDSIGWEMASAERFGLINKLAQLSASLPSTLAIYSRLFDSLGTRVLLKEGGCYGGASVAPIVAARRMGIVTAEYQHGIISRGHDAYNVAPELLGSGTYKSCLPEYLLTFGPWWNDKLRLPITPVSVGGPHRSVVVANRARVGFGGQARKDVLILSDGVDADIFIGLASQIVHAIGNRGLRVVFRPHPVERDARDWGTELPIDVALDQNIDLYDSFESALVVVSEVSTGAFEAIDLVPHVVVRDTPKTRFNFPDNPFALFRSVDGLLALLENDSRHGVSNPSKAIWSDDWQGNYTTFLQHCGVEI